MIDPVLQKGDARQKSLEKAWRLLSSLPTGKAFRLSVKEVRPRRTEQQNRYLWGVCYAELMKHLPGWEAEDVHEYMLGEWSGWEVMEGMGRKRLRPIKRSSGLNKQEFADFIAFVQKKAAEHGVVIPDANIEAEE